MISRSWCFRFVFSIAAVMAVLSLVLPVPAGAAEKTVLILKFDDSEHSELASKLHRKVVTTISGHLEKAGFQTLKGDKHLSHKTDPHGLHPDEALLARIRTDNGSQVDYVAIIQILANTVLLQESTRLEVEINGRMLKVSNGDVLARFDLSVPSTLNAPLDCDRNCIVQLLEDNTEFLANGLGQVLTKRLQKSHGSDHN